MTILPSIRSNFGEHYRDFVFLFASGLLRGGSGVVHDGGLLFACTCALSPRANRRLFFAHTSSKPISSTLHSSPHLIRI